MINHIGFVMDGNRRWAKARLLPTFAGHKAGADNLINIVNLCAKKEIKYVTFWALSTENIKSRSSEELEGLFSLIEKIPSYLKKMLNNGVKLEVIGDMTLLPESTQKVLNDAILETKDNTSITMILAIAYGGRNEIIRGIKKLIASGDDISTLDEKSFLNYLDTGRFPEPELLVRTGGDIRMSGFMQYVSDYSEFYFSNKYWPDFDETELNIAIDKFMGSKRNFGK